MDHGEDEMPPSSLIFAIDLRQARETFQKIYPNEEFLPRAPDPEEIVFDGDESAAQANDFTQTDDEVKEKIDELVDGIEDQVKCIGENSAKENAEEQS